MTCPAAIPLAFELPDELVDAVAERAAEIVRRDRRFLSKQALAEHLGVPPRTIKTFRQHGMPAYCGRPLLFDLREVEAWISKRPV
jgi:predicted transcriptional regulator